MKNVSRQLLSAVLSCSLGLTATANYVLALDDADSDWKEVDKDVTLKRANRFERNLKETNYKATDEVRALIVFDGDSASTSGYLNKKTRSNYLLTNYMNQLEAQQDKMTEKISEEVLNGETLDVRYQFTLFANAVSADVTYEKVEKIREVDGVKEVYVLPQYEPQVVKDANPNTITSGEMVGSYNTWESGYSGEGMRIAIVDTGLDTDHPSFDGHAFKQALLEKADEEGKNVSEYDLLDKDEIAQVIDKLQATSMYAENGGNASIDDYYHSEKVPFGFSYIDQDMDVTHDNDTEGDHGTHVAGIATANKYVPTEDGFEPQSEGVVGIAPNAQLLVMKVFGNNGGAYADDYMVAIQDAILLGADAINLSLGSPNGGESKETAEADAYINNIFNELEKTNTVVSMSSGNSGAWSDYSVYGGLAPEDVNLQTNGSPGSYTNAFTVASAENAGKTGHVVIVNDANLFYTETDGTPFTSLDTNGNGTDYEYVFIDGIGVEEDYEGLDVEGKIVFVSRGETSFSEKHDMAASHGAVGVIVYNNQPGTIAMDLSNSESDIPCVSITLADGMYVKEHATVENDTYVGTLTVSSEIQSSYNSEENVTMSDFSSWGVPGDLSLKPEITAPGGNIYSTLDDGQYGLMSGTSMAAPSVAGMSALLIQYIEENKLNEKTGLSSRALAQSLLMSTANVLEEDGVPYSPRKQGAGLANIEYATTSPVTVLMGNDGKVKAELGDDAQRTGKYTFSFTLKNLTDERQYYSFDSQVMSEKLVDGLVVGSSTLLSPSVEFTNTSLSYDVNEDGKVDKVDALIFLQHVNQSLENENIKANEEKFDFNQDGALTTVDVHLYLNKLENDELNDRVIVVDDETEVTVTIQLSDEDKAYLDSTFVNGMYVDGYVTLDGNIDLSVPFLAFYGNWADPSMFEHVTLLDGPEDDYSYSGTTVTNAFVDADDYILGGNPFADDKQYLPERNAISADTEFAGVYYTLIRNSTNTNITVTNADTGEVYKKVDLGERLAEFYHDNQGAWLETLLYDELGWNVTDQNGQPLPEGTRVNVTVHAYPDYYAESETDGKGTSMTYSYVVDNTAPVVSDITTNEDGVLSITAQDNEYISSVLILDRNFDIMGAVSPNQTEKAVEMTIDIACPKNVLYVAVADYAGNVTVYGRINNTDEEDTEFTTGIEISDTELTLFDGESTQLSAYAYPETLLDTRVVWESSNEEVVVVDENGYVTALSEGSAVITATTVAVDADGNHAQAECAITVKQIDCEFTGLVLDLNEMTSNWSSFTARNPLEVTNYVENNWFNSATTWEDFLFGCEVDTGDLVLMDPQTYEELGRIGLGGLIFTDMSEGLTTGYLAATMENYVLWLNMETGKIKSLDLSKYVGGLMNGIAYVGNKMDSQYGECEVYAVSTTNGEVYLLSYGVDMDAPLYFDDVNVARADVDEAYYDCVLSSLYFDQKTNSLFWSSCVEETWASDFYAISLKTMEAKYLSSTEEGILNYGLLDPSLVGQGPVEYQGKEASHKQMFTDGITESYLDVSSLNLRGE